MLPNQEKIENAEGENTLVGALLDVSGSMKGTYALSSRSKIETQKVNSIFDLITTMTNVESSLTQDFFALAFGLNQVPTCDLISLLGSLTEENEGPDHLASLLQKYNSDEDKVERRQKELASLLDTYYLSSSKYIRILTGKPTVWGIEPMIQLLERHGVNNIRSYAEKYLPEKEAGSLFEFYARDKEALTRLIDRLPSRCKLNNPFSDMLNLNVTSQDNSTDNSRNSLFSFASRFTQKVGHVGVNIMKEGAKRVPIPESVEKGMAEKQIFDALKDARQALFFSQVKGKKEELYETQYWIKEKLEKAKQNKIVRGKLEEEEEKNVKELEEDYEKFKEELDKLEKVEKAMSEKLDFFSKEPQLYRSDKVLSLLGSFSRSKENFDSQELVHKIEPYIYGGTPMCQALRSAMTIYRGSSHKQKVLFILSDGQATDGDPEPICQELKDSHSVIIFSCFLSLDQAPNPRKLFDKPDKSWDKGRLNMFNMSSVVSNTLPAMSVLRENGWELPLSGESRLFAQINHPEIVEEFCRIVNHISEGDALLDMIGKVSLDIYINQTLTDFKPKEQEGSTCYANAVAAVFHLASCRVVGREAPDFYKLRETLIQAYGKKGAKTRNVLQECCPNYDLKFKEVDEAGARLAIAQRRPVIATFGLYDEEWDLFSIFYGSHKTGILESKDLKTEVDLNSKRGGHAVVLVRCGPDFLTFMNSWGTGWADDGFFKVRNSQVLKCKFYDVFWTLDQLSKSEIEAFNLQKQEKATKLVNNLPEGTKNLPYKCQKCKQESLIKEFSGSLFKAICPKCTKEFVPTAKELVLNLYNRKYYN